IVMDWIATLGMFGIAWVMLLGWWAWLAGRGAIDRSTPMSTSPLSAPNDGVSDSRDQTRCLLTIIALSTLGACFIQGSLITPDAALVRVFGLVLWALLGWGILSLLRAGVMVSAALGAGAMALLAHAQIDMDLSWTQSCGIGLILIAVGASMAKTND